MVAGQILGPLACRDDRETASASPVDHLADQRRLIAVGERVDDAGLARASGQQGTGERVGLDVDHDHMDPVGDGRERKADAGARVPGGVDHDVGRAAGDQGLGIVGEPGAATLERLARAPNNPLCLPAGARQVLARALRRQVGDSNEMQARRGAGLGEEHGAELAGPDKADPDRPVRYGALNQHAVKIHGTLLRRKALGRRGAPS